MRDVGDSLDQANNQWQYPTIPISSCNGCKWSAKQCQQYLTATVSGCRDIALYSITARTNQTNAIQIVSLHFIQSVPKYFWPKWFGATG